MMRPQIAIIGGGRLGAALARGLIRKGLPRDRLLIAQRHPEKRADLLREGFNVHPRITNFSELGTIIVAVKPNDIFDVLKSIRNNANRETIIVSAVSGVRAEILNHALGDEFPLFRAKFSIFVEIQQKIIPFFQHPGLYGYPNSKKTDAIEDLFNSLGEVKFVSDERLMEMSGWELSSLPGIIFPKIIEGRLADAASADREIIQEFILAGLENMLRYFTHKLEEKKMAEEVADLSQIIDDLIERIVTPGGANDIMRAYLNNHDCWRLTSTAREIFEHRMNEMDNESL